MGRILKRVPLDFKWPRKQVWKGYVNPYRTIECKACEGSCLNDETKKINDEWYAFENAEYAPNPFRPGSRYNVNAHSNNITQIEVEALVKEGRLWDVMGSKYMYDDETDSWMVRADDKLIGCKKPEIPTAEQVNEWNLRGMGHDGCNQWICVKARAKDLGVYGECEYCDGEGMFWFSDEIRDLYEKFSPVDPPSGEGFQMWENTSEGSPCSPVFKTFDELCEWCADNASIFGTKDFVSKEEWAKALGDGFYTLNNGNIIF